MSSMSKTAAMLALAGGTGFSRSLGNIGAKELSKYVKKTNKRSKKKQYQSSAREKQMVWSEPKRHVEDIEWATRNGNALHFIDVTSIGQGDSNDSRFRQCVYVRGVKVRFVCRNLGVDLPGVLRWALIQPKSNRDTGSVNVKNEFFRGNKTLRGVDFDSVALGFHKQTYEINPDLYKVYGKGEVLLMCKDTSLIEPGNVPSEYNMTRYIPVNAKVTFEGASETDSNTGLVFVYWFCPNNLNTTIETSNQINSGGTFITYFKDMF